MKLTGQQLKNIIAESVDNILNERYYGDEFFNPGGVKNPKVQAMGKEAMTDPRGRGVNRCDWAVMKKHTGGENAPYKLAMIFNDAVKGDKKAAEQFFRAMKHMPQAQDDIKELLRQYNIDAHAEKYGREWADKNRGNYI